MLLFFAMLFTHIHFHTYTFKCPMPKLFICHQLVSSIQPQSKNLSLKSLPVGLCQRTETQMSDRCPLQACSLLVSELLLAAILQFQNKHFLNLSSKIENTAYKLSK